MMPTPTGLPKKGDRVSFAQPLPSDWNPEPIYGTVVHRSRGDYFALYVRWDDQRPGRGSHLGRDVEMMVDAAYHLSRGHLKVLDPYDEPSGAGADPYGRPDPQTHPEYWTE